MKGNLARFVKDEYFDIQPKILTVKNPEKEFYFFQCERRNLKDCLFVEKGKIIIDRFGRKSQTTQK